VTIAQWPGLSGPTPTAGALQSADSPPESRRCHCAGGETQLETDDAGGDQRHHDGVAHDPLGRSRHPLPGPLVDARGKWRPQDLYWITRNGIKMSGMPAWRFTMADADLWAVVAFMQRLPALDAAQFRALAERRATARCDREDDVEATQRVDADRGRLALAQYACAACHSIPGVVGSEVHVSPPLAGFAKRQLIAGSVANTPDMLVRWIRDPRSIDPLTTMPAMGVGERDARDIAAYLGTLH